MATFMEFNQSDEGVEETVLVNLDHVLCATYNQKEDLLYLNLDRDDSDGNARCLTVRGKEGRRVFDLIKAHRLSDRVRGV
jgi:hypothetical protein